MNWEYIKTNLEDFVRFGGEAEVQKLVRKVGEQIALLESEVDRRGWLGFFTEHDWMNYAGCSRFNNGVRPLLGELKIDNGEGRGAPESGPTIMGIAGALIIVSGRSADTLYNSIVDVELQVCAEGDSGYCEYYCKEFATLGHALAELHLIHDSPVPVRIEQIKMLGYK